ncbi:hypothetical protein BB561_002378 [Smittium simulii]|uniref:Peptidase S1 domain-containing protein n=1 Tax=Smittium simulii TaxID=133385 RepID=A0A2T9YQL6_9FUNG|nr:hypothetical protein BB561_002378 [Smittium simulii]
MWINQFKLKLAVNAIFLGIYVCASVIPSKNIERTLGKRIIGGEYAHPSSSGFAVMIQINFGSEGLFMCGGSIISNQYILTAAHCLSSDKKAASEQMITVGLGSNNMNSLMQMPAKRLIVHPQWDANTVKNDIALIKVDTMAFSNDLYPISLPSSAVPTNAQVYALGWGRTNSQNSDISSILKKASLVTGNINACVNINPSAQRNPEALICTINNITRQDTCVGDSGGPLVAISVQNSDRSVKSHKISDTFKPDRSINSQKISDTFRPDQRRVDKHFGDIKRRNSNTKKSQVLVGITSFGTNNIGQGDSKCGSENAIGFYTNILYFRDWIRSVAAI